MNESARELLREATADELLACIQLLAISVVQHRSHSGFVALRKSREHLRGAADETDVTGLFVKGKQVLQEALEMVRSLATAPEPLVVAETVKSSAESRTQFRIRIDLPIKVLWPDDTRPVDARLEDISWGGVSFYIEEARPVTSNALRILLPRPQGGSISLESTILRTSPQPDGGLKFAVRFSSLSTRDEAKLEDILEHLARSADDEGQRHSARLTQRLELQFDGEQELRSTLDDISAGGLGITVPDPVQIGQSLQIVISTLDESCSLRLRARVVRQESVKLRSTEVYRVGLKFEHPSEELKKRTSELIAKMAAIKKK